LSRSQATDTCGEDRAESIGVDCRTPGVLERFCCRGDSELFDAVEIVSDKTADTYRRIFARFDGPSKSLMVGNSLRSDVPVMPGPLRPSQNALRPMPQGATTP